MESALHICIKVKQRKKLIIICKKYGWCQGHIKSLTENSVYIMNRLTKDLQVN